ncbi:MAG: hypothetical protein MOIL_00118 [Candidatus Methanolliviera sp. GoM_oil]|nr:MAG: hypothetical protein MOIL_00118 [Candidatus Methanolliviera sp. GoM_oil]
MPVKYMKRGRKDKKNRDEDPLAAVANLFDVALVFALGMMVFILLSVNLPELLTASDLTIIKNPGENMEVIVKHGTEIERVNVTEEMIETEVVGEMGRIYVKSDGGLIYVPSGGEKK